MLRFEMTTQVRGAVMLARRAFVTEHFGEEAWRRVIETLAPEEQRQLSGMLLTANWYPFELNRRLDEAIVSVLGGGSSKVFERIGAQSAIENLNGHHKHFLSPGDPQAFMAKADRIYSFYYDTGHRTYEPTGDSSGVMTTYDAETYSAADCLTVIGWYKKALEMCGARAVEITEETCRAQGGPHCRYRLSWKV